jgi:Arc/MetJ family transcription regulator
VGWPDPNRSQNPRASAAVYQRQFPSVNDVEASHPSGTQMLEGENGRISHHAHLDVPRRLQRTDPGEMHTRNQRNTDRLTDVHNGVEVYTSMRTNIVMDDKQMGEALRATGLKTKREAVEEGLRILLRQTKQAEIRRFRGKLDWHGDLDAMRVLMMSETSITSNSC